jgi:nicotinamide mononucleotide (NMN) deamidase PncC/8-oxo-dGTP pyrophosphatase MutT (NUDIX family)
MQHATTFDLPCPCFVCVRGLPETSTLSIYCHATADTLTLCSKISVMADQSADVQTRTVPMPNVTPGPLAPLAESAASALRAKGHTVAVFESTSGGLIQAALQSVAGSSVYMTCGAVTYHSSRAAAVLGCNLSKDDPPRAGRAEEYVLFKKIKTASIARRMRDEVGAVWCISESGACGPTFNVSGIATGFSVITIAGPVERAVVVESTHAQREENMWGFAKAALDLLEECLALFDKGPAVVREVDDADPTVLSASEDRYGGVEIEVPETAVKHGMHSFQRALKRRIESWVAAGKRGLWLKVPMACTHLLGAARDEGFRFHHAKAEYAMMTRWLPRDLPSPLPAYAFTQIGVGGVVVNSKGEVLMVKERVSPLPQFQGCWKLPGGLADPGEDFADTVAREVKEETGVDAALVGVVSLRHSHGFRFGQGDIYVVVKLLATNDAITIDEHELQDARWMKPDEIRALVASSTSGLEGKVSENNWKMISNALYGCLILGTEIANSRGPRSTMLYTAAPPPPAASAASAL